MTQTVRGRDKLVHVEIILLHAERGNEGSEDEKQMERRNLRVGGMTDRILSERKKDSIGKSIVI